MTIYAGKLRHRLILQKPSGTVDSFGEPSDEWADVAQIWASVEPLTGDELVQARAIKSVETHRVVTRWGVPVDPSMRLLWLLGGKLRVFEIVSVSNIEERNRELLLAVKETDDQRGDNP